MSMLPQLPVLYNPLLIKKHTKLVVSEDIGLANILEAQKQQKEKGVGLAAAKQSSASKSKDAASGSKGPAGGSGKTKASG